MCVFLKRCSASLLVLVLLSQVKFSEALSESVVYDQDEPVVEEDEPLPTIARPSSFKRMSSVRAAAAVAASDESKIKSKSKRDRYRYVDR